MGTAAFGRMTLATALQRAAHANSQFDPWQPTTHIRRRFAAEHACKIFRTREPKIRDKLPHPYADPGLPVLNSILHFCDLQVVPSGRGSELALQEELGSAGTRWIDGIAAVNISKLTGAGSRLSRLANYSAETSQASCLKDSLAAQVVPSVMFSAAALRHSEKCRSGICVAAEVPGRRRTRRDAQDHPMDEDCTWSHVQCLCIATMKSINLDASLAKQFTPRL